MIRDVIPSTFLLFNFLLPWVDIAPKNYLVEKGYVVKDILSNGQPWTLEAVRMEVRPDIAFI